MMNPYVLYLFTLPVDEPESCTEVRDFVLTLTKAQQATIEYVALRTDDGELTQLAKKLAVDSVPTLVVTHESVSCELDADGDEDCDYIEKPVERFIGTKAITEHLEVTIQSYTYANPPE
jgi:hypothetical protein